MQKKFYFCLSSLFLCISSLGLNFVNIGNIETIRTHNIKGTYLALLGLILLIYLIYTKKNQIIGYLISLGGYIFTIYSTYDFCKDLGDIGINGFQFLQLGFYLYILSFIVLIISIFINENKHSKKEVQKQLTDSIGITEQEVTKNMLLGNYILGIKGYKFDGIVLLKNSEKDKILYLESILDNKDIIKNSINYEKINNVSYQIQTSIQTQKNDIALENDKEMANYLLSISLFSNPIVSYESNELLNVLTNEYEKNVIKNYFHVKINFINENNEEKEIIIKTSKNPEIFVNKINCNRKTEL